MLSALMMALFGAMLVWAAWPLIKQIGYGLSALAIYGGIIGATVVALYLWPIPTSILLGAGSIANAIRRRNA
jgi:hypothetical protein